MTNLEPGPRFTAADAASLIAEPGDDFPHVVNQLRRFAQSGLVRTRGLSGSGRTAGNLFALSDIAAASALRTLTFMGVADTPVLQEASFGLYRGARGADANPNRHPVTEALLAHRAPYFPGEWVLRLDFAQTTESGRDLCARVFDLSVGSLPQSHFHPGRAAMVQIPLTRVLTALATHIGG